MATKILYVTDVNERDTNWGAAGAGVGDANDLPAAVAAAGDLVTQPTAPDRSNYLTASTYAQDISDLGWLQPIWEPDLLAEGDEVTQVKLWIEVRDMESHNSEAITVELGGGQVAISGISSAAPTWRSATFNAGTGLSPSWRTGELPTLYANTVNVTSTSFRIYGMYLEIEYTPVAAGGARRPLGAAAMAVGLSI